MNSSENQVLIGSWKKLIKISKPRIKKKHNKKSKLRIKKNPSRALRTGDDAFDRLADFKRLPQLIIIPSPLIEGMRYEESTPATG